MTSKNTPESAVPIVWSVTGSDSGDGTRSQADLRAIEAFKAHGRTVLVGLLGTLASDAPPAAIKAANLGRAEDLQLLAHWIDRLRQQNPNLPVVVTPLLRAAAMAADPALLEGYRTALLPRATLITLSRSEAAALLGCAPLHSRQDVEQAASALLALGCQAVVITAGDEADGIGEDYAATAHASGWLSLPQLTARHVQGISSVLAASAAAALARGFIEIEAIILAKMATTHALRQACDSGTGPAQPLAGFALARENLPTLRLEGQAEVAEFSRLTDPDLGLYAVVDSAAWVQRVLDAGVRTVQLRIKDPKHPHLRAEMRASIAAARTAHAQLFINDHWALAIEEGAYGVHLGQDDLACADLNAIARAGLRLGLSTHSYWEVCCAWGLQPSYIACGPIHPTQVKRMPWIAQGNDNLAYWCARLALPVVAIAGMDRPRVTQAMQCGAAGVAVISAITAANSPEAEIAGLLEAVQAGRRLPRRAAPELPQATLQRTRRHEQTSAG